MNNYEVYMQLLALLNDDKAQIQINEAVDNALKVCKKLLSTISASERLPEISSEIANMYKVHLQALMAADFTREEAFQLLLKNKGF